MQTATATRTEVPAAPIDDVEELLTKFPLQYTWNYQMVREELTNLYEKAKRDQWNATDQLAWSTSVDPESELVPDFQIPIYGTHIWRSSRRRRSEDAPRGALVDAVAVHARRAGRAPRDRADRRRDAVDRIEVLRVDAGHGRGAHVEVYSRYLREKLTRQYPVNAHLKTLLDQILTDSRWDMKYLGMQILVEGLAMAGRSASSTRCATSRC
jgi:hypothetical protein